MERQEEWILQAALVGVIKTQADMEIERKTVAEKRSALEDMLADLQKAKISASTNHKRGMSEEGRRAVAEAQRKRWAKIKRGK